MHLQQCLTYNTNEILSLPFTDEETEDIHLHSFAY